jgi:hypothetical protein
MDRSIGMGGLVGIMALMLHSVVERNIQIPADAFLYTFLFAMVLRIVSSPHSALHSRGRSGPSGNLPSTPSTTTFML